MQIKQRIHLPMKLCDEEGIRKTQLKSVQSALSDLCDAWHVFPPKYEAWTRFNSS